MDNKALAPLAGVLVVALVVAAPVVTVAASQSAIPGEALYGIKRATEAITAPSALDKLDRRVGELGALVERGSDSALIEQSARDIRATAEAAASETDTAEQIDRAQEGLNEATMAIQEYMDSLPADHPALPGLQTALDSIARAYDGLDTAKEALELGQGGELPDVAP